MGNSPSKDDPLPTSSSSTLTGSGELEPDEPAPALSHLNHQHDTTSTTQTTTTTPGSSLATAASNYNSNSISNSNSKSNIKDDNIIKNDKNTNNTKNSNSISIKKKVKSRKQSPPDFDLDLEIGMSMAHLLKSNSSPPASSPIAATARDINSSNKSVAIPDTLTPPAMPMSEYGSSVESDKSDSSAMSPVFTTVGEVNDEDLLSSLGSSSPSGKNFFYKVEVREQTSSARKLDAIAEAETSVESTPEPKRGSKSRSRQASKLSVDSDRLSISNLKKHDKKTREMIGRQLTKNVSSSSSSLSSSPPLVYANKKMDVDVDSVIDRLLAVGMTKPKSSSSRHTKDKLPVTSSEIKFILHKARSIFLDQPTLLRLSPSVKIVGDIHGQFHDLIRIFNTCGYPPYSNYLFLGDYVDRGHKSLETILLLLCYKIKYPENFFMLRGNHESANITKIYGFYDECKRRLPAISGNHKMWKVFIDVFNTLPIAATINDKIFCIHGGLSPDLHDLEQIDNIRRPTDIPERGLLADLLWSDPDPAIKNFSVTNWPKNDRGVSYCFGKKHVDYFCSTFKMDLVVRGHMVVEDGYEFFNKRKLVTVFSAPNYCGEFDNFGAVMSVDKNLYCSFELLKPQ